MDLDPLVEELPSDGAATLMCVERDPEACHRSIVANRLADDYAVAGIASATVGVVAGDELYGLPLERFVPERAALVKALRAEGRREDAAQVAKLRKPSVAAWAVNQLVRTQGRAAAELFAAGDALLASAFRGRVGRRGRALAP